LFRVIHFLFAIFVPSILFDTQTHIMWKACLPHCASPDERIILGRGWQGTSYYELCDLRYVIQLLQDAVSAGVCISKACQSCSVDVELHKKYICSNHYFQLVIVEIETAILWISNIIPDTLIVYCCYDNTHG